MKIRKTPGTSLTTYILPFVMVAFLWTSCSEEQLFPGNARIKTAFRLTSPNALGGSITIQEAYLKLERITVTGRLGDKDTPDANYPIPPEDPPYRLTQGDTARVSLTLPTSTYDQMDLHLFLLQTDYNLIVYQKTPEQTPPPANDGNDGPTGGVTDPNNQNDGDANDGNDQNDGKQDDDDDEGDPEDDGDDGDHEEDEDRDDRDDDGGDNNDKDDGDGKKNKDKKKKGKKDGKNDDDDDRDDDNDDDDERDDDDRDDDDRIRGNDINGTVDLDHFFQHAKPSLVVFATLSLNGADVNVVFAVTDVERITIRATQNDGSQITVDEHGRGTVNFDPERWFQSISTTDLQNASLQTYQGKPVMFIHKDVNSALFGTLLSNLTSSATFEVAASSDH